MSTDAALSAEPLPSDAAASASASDFISSMLGGESPAIESTPVHEPYVRQTPIPVAPKKAPEVVIDEEE